MRRKDTNSLAMTATGHSKNAVRRRCADGTSANPVNSPAAAVICSHASSVLGSAGDVLGCAGQTAPHLAHIRQ
jgi:hypothetical protein